MSVHSFAPEDTLISYLPLAHVYGRIMYLLMLVAGGRVGNYCGDVKLILKDLALLKPTYLPCVPRLLNRFYDLFNARI